MKHYVYFLYHPDGALLYIGRSTDPKERCGVFKRREDVPAMIGRLEEFDCFENAAARELEAIEHHQPLYNQKMHSGPGMLGKHHTDEARKAIASKQLGKRPGPETRKRMSLAKIGRPSPMKGKPGPVLTPEQRARLSASKLGKKRGPYKKKGAASCV
jgi:hypothetical protein